MRLPQRLPAIVRLTRERDRRPATPLRRPRRLLGMVVHAVGRTTGPADRLSPMGGRQESGGRAMPDDSMRTVLVSLGAGIGVALAKAVTAAFTGSTALAAEAEHSLT